METVYHGPIPHPLKQSDLIYLSDQKQHTQTNTHTRMHTHWTTTAGDNVIVLGRK